MKRNKVGYTETQSRAVGQGQWFRSLEQWTGEIHLHTELGAVFFFLKRNAKNKILTVR